MNSVWRTKTGGIIPIRDMETSHIENTMRYIERNDFELTIFTRCYDGCEEDTVNVRDVHDRMHLELRLRKLEVQK